MIIKDKTTLFFKNKVEAFRKNYSIISAKNRKLLCVITCNAASSKDIKDISYIFPIEFCSTRCVILSITAQITCVTESIKENIFGVICTSS